MPKTRDLMLADWRREINALYGRVRQENDSRRAWRDFRSTRDKLFRQHPQSPLSESQRESFNELHYYSYRPDFRIIGKVATIRKPQRY